MAVNTVERIIELLSPEAVARGLELVWVELAGSHGRRIVRVFLDREGGIDVDTLAAANGWIGESLDADPGSSGPYTLEVSSPGLDRPLRTIVDFARFTGSRAVVSTKETHAGRRTYTGRIAAVDGDTIVLEVDGGAVRLLHADIAKARLRADITIGHEGSGERS
ncbi:MAG: ribosome maturation factor RimP [Coriobacteriia bacterium]